MKRKIFVTLVLIILFSVSVLADDSAQAKAVVQTFYKVQTFNNDVFSLRVVNARKIWFTPELYKLYLKTVRLQAAYEKKNPNEKPEFDGLGFHPQAEMYPQIPVVGNAALKDETALVDVNFFYIEKNKKRTFHTKYVIELKKQGAKWLINDIIYDDGERLSEAMTKAYAN